MHRLFPFYRSARLRRPIRLQALRQKVFSGFVKRRILEPLQDVEAESWFVQGKSHQRGQRPTKRIVTVEVRLRLQRRQTDVEEPQRQRREIGVEQRLAVGFDADAVETHVEEQRQRQHFGAVLEPQRHVLLRQSHPDRLAAAVAFDFDDQDHRPTLALGSAKTGADRRFAHQINDPAAAGGRGQKGFLRQPPHRGSVQPRVPLGKEQRQQFVEERLHQQLQPLVVVFPCGVGFFGRRFHAHTARRCSRSSAWNFQLATCCSVRASSLATSLLAQPHTISSSTHLTRR